MGRAESEPILVEDFESAEVGGIPEGFEQQGLVQVVDDVAHTGKKSLRIEPRRDGMRRINLRGEKVEALGGSHWGRIYFKVQLPHPLPPTPEPGQRPGVVHSTIVGGTAKSPYVTNPVEQSDADSAETATSDEPNRERPARERSAANQSAERQSADRQSAEGTNAGDDANREERRRRRREGRGQRARDIDEPPFGNIEVRVVDTVMRGDGKHQYLYNVQPRDGRREYASGSSYDYEYTDDWTLAEWYVDFETQSYRFWVNGEEIERIALNGGPGNYRRIEIPAQFDMLFFGWWNYQPVEEGFTVWLDDIAIGKERLGPVKTAESAK